MMCFERMICYMLADTVPSYVSACSNALGMPQMHPPPRRNNCHAGWLLALSSQGAGRTSTRSD